MNTINYASVTDCKPSKREAENQVGTYVEKKKKILSYK